QDDEKEKESGFAHEAGLFFLTSSTRRPHLRPPLPLPPGACSPGNTERGGAHPAARRGSPSYSCDRSRNPQAPYRGGAGRLQSGKGSAPPCWQRGKTSPSPSRRSPGRPCGTNSSTDQSPPHHAKVWTAPEIAPAISARAHV